MHNKTRIARTNRTLTISNRTSKARRQNISKAISQIRGGRIGGERISKSISETISTGIAEGISNSIAERISERIDQINSKIGSERIHQRIDQRISKRISQIIAEIIVERIVERIDRNHRKRAKDHCINYRPNSGQTRNPINFPCHSTILTHSESSSSPFVLSSLAKVPFLLVPQSHQILQLPFNMQPTSLPSPTIHQHTNSITQQYFDSQHFAHFQTESRPFIGHFGHLISFIAEGGELSEDSGAWCQGKRISQSVSPLIRPQIRLYIQQKFHPYNKLKLPCPQKPTKIPRRACPSALQSIPDLAAIFRSGKLCLINDIYCRSLIILMVFLVD